MKFSKIITDYKDNLDVELMLSNVCNYKCTYCFPGSNEGDLRWPDKNYDTVVGNIKELFRFYQKYHNKKKFHVKVMGGEPTVWSKLPEFIADIKSMSDSFVRMSTNASRTMRYWKQHSDKFDQIMISVHNQFADMDHIIEVANHIYSTGKTNLYVGVLMDPDNWELSVNNFEYLMANSKEWHLAVAPVHFDGLTRYTQEQLIYLNNAPKRKHKQPIDFYTGLTAPLFLDHNGNKVDTDQHKIIVNKENQFKGYRCNIGLDRIFVYGNGEIKGSCGQKFFPNNLNLYSNNFIDNLITEPLSPSICEQTACSCSSEVVLTKVKEVYEN